MASVKVAVRVRPFNKRETELSSELVVQMHGSQVILQNVPSPSNAATHAAGDRSRPHKFTFDYAYWSHNASDHHFANQAQVFQDLGTDVVDNAFSGYNACVFAYGQTGSGKTYTMMGDTRDRDEECGLIPRICSTMFRKMEEYKQEENTTFRTEVSYLEIYNEKVRDLLQNECEHKLKVREHPKEGPYVQNLSKHLVMDYAEILELMARGNAVRTTASTKMNDTSSRSHAIFTITFVKAGVSQGLPYETVSKIHLVDLAGSERANATGATGQRLKEGGHINKSLVTLGSVISALAEASSLPSNSQPALKPVFIPYRDSVLTWLLKDSLGGNSKTIMIATISPAEVNHGETLSTLRYANRAKNIINKPTVNEDANVKLIRELREEIERLRSMMTLDPVTQQKLAIKEAQERHLTEEWTEKWREAANILKEQHALALKRTGQGVMLDSEKPHLIGIDEDLLSTGITLYHLREGDIHIGNDESSDIVLKGPCILQHHCVVRLQNSCVTLIPTENAVCIVNAVRVQQPTRLSQGCVVVLGKTNMFRYNDPTEAAHMRLNMNSDSFKNQSLLSQSLSDLRNVALSHKQLNLPAKTLPLPSLPAPAAAHENPPASKNSSGIFEDNDSKESPVSQQSDQSKNRLASPDSAFTTSQDDLQDDFEGELSTEEMHRLVMQINEQKDIIMKCLESENCGLEDLNEQITLLQTLQGRYAKLELEQLRSSFVGSRSGLDNKEASSEFESHFASLVEQEVDRRLFEERMLRQEAEYQEKELIRMERERELNRLQRQHEREIYVLKRKLLEANNMQTLHTEPDACKIVCAVSSFCVVGVGSDAHFEYEVKVFTDDASWSLFRRFRRFRDLHLSLSSKYGPVISALSFPSRTFFRKSISHQVAQERQKLLQVYLSNLLQACSRIRDCPLFQNSSKNALLKLSDFFQPNSEDVCQQNLA